MGKTLVLDETQVYKRLEHLSREMSTLKRMIHRLSGERTGHPHITCLDNVCGGVPVIAGTRIAVWMIAAMHRRGETVENILDAYPWLSPAQVYDALAYYHDHKEEIERQIEENSEKKQLSLPPL